uniref:Uncharacterized protein n=1 Tax=Romanomermis culicivorax TaxID=13658 RepID=A0A915KLG6_ROMCU
MALLHLVSSTPRISLPRAYSIQRISPPAGFACSCQNCTRSGSLILQSEQTSRVAYQAFSKNVKIYGQLKKELTLIFIDTIYTSVCNRYSGKVVTVWLLNMAKR